MPELMDGAAASRHLLQGVAGQAQVLALQGLRPGLATVLVGEDAASQVYVRAKGLRAQECGFHSVQHTLAASTSGDSLLKLIDSLNADPAIHGILVQLPLPKGLDSQRIVQAIAPHKDVDGFHFQNVGKLGSGQALDSAFVPCTPAGAMLLLQTVRGPDLSGLHAVVIGRSNIVGKPMAALLLAAHATVTVAHSRSSELPALARLGDILVSAVGQPGLVRGPWIKPGATVIDVGINRVADPDGKTRLVGDVLASEALAVAGAFTPVPGGVGPMTIAMLMANTLNACRRASGLPAWQPSLPGA